MQRQTPLLRALLCLPCAALHFALLPYLVDSVNDPLSVLPTTGLLSFAAFKIIALVMSRGVLVHVPQQYWHFVVACCLPVIPESAFAASRASKHTSYGSRRNSLRHQALSLLSRAACGTLASAALHIQWLPRLAVYWLYMLITCMFLGGATDCFALLTTALLGMRLAPSFDRPYMSGSLTEFWSQRWNVTTTYLFRVMVYDPIVEQKMMASAPATAACSAGGVQQCLQDSIMTCEHTSSCNGVAAAKQHRNLVSSDQLSATQSSSTKGRQDQQQRPQQDKDAQNGVAANTSNHTSSSRSRQRAGGSTMRRFAGMQATFASSPQKNIIRSCQAQHRQGPHSNNPQNSSSCPATWSPGYGLLDHKALLKAPAAPAGTRPVAAARRLILTSKQSSTKAKHSPQKQAAAPPVPKVTKAFLRQRFHASQNALLNACSLPAAAAATTLAATTALEAATANAVAIAAAASSGGSTTSINGGFVKGHDEDAADATAPLLVPGSSAVEQPTTASHHSSTALSAAEMESVQAAMLDAAQQLSRSSTDTTNLQQPAARLSCKPSSLSAAFSKLKVIIPNPPAAAASFLDAPIQLVSSPGNTSASCSDGAASSAGAFKAMMVQSSIPSSQLYPPGVAAPAQLGWDTAASPYSSASPCEYDGIEGAAAVLAGKQQTASDQVAVTILRPYTADAAGPQHVDKALISLSLLLDGDRVRAVIKPLQPSPVPSIKANPASTTAARIKSAAWQAAGGDARARDPVQAASTMYDALRSSCGKVRPQCPRPSIARRRWQAAVAAIVFQRHYPAMLRLQDETAMKNELMTASLSGPSSMIEKWLNFDPQNDLHQHADHMACRQAVIAAGPAADPTSRCSLIPAAYAGVQVIDTVAYVHLEMDGSMSGLMASQWLRDLKCMFSVDASGSVTASGSSMSDHNSSGFDESGRTSVQSPILAGPVINFVKPASLAAAAVTTSDGPADGSSSRARTKTASKPRSGWRGILHGVFSRKAHKQNPE
uniref:Uncharacterized protein n=1 Tax=Tetradesmus obliquus TaxID=3088 RepID=A0A383VSV6_TETOB|eukprot:jgi/Sobl393_1/14948/SZX68608.1